jgi:glycosyltransferase involved in cell wall biosynthesis
LTRQAPQAPQFSLVVPAFNEAALLPRLLDSIDAARQHFRGGMDAVEVIVADNASTDATAGIASTRGCTVAPVEKRCIAAARNGGAAVARGATLCFVDADMQVHPETFNAIADAIVDARVVAGATGVTMERWSAGIVATWMALLPFVWITGMDTGVVFCRRSDFDAIGGYDEERLIAEDVDFLMRLRRVGKPRGQGLTRALRAKAVSSARKFDNYGEWHYFTQMPRIAWRMLRNPYARDDFVHRYWYGDR